VLGTTGGPMLPNVTGAKLKNRETGEVTEHAIHGIFIAIGHDPATQVFRGHVDIDEEGYVKVQPNSTKTNVPGVFAAGAVADKVWRQAVTAAGMGCMAGLEAERYLASLPAPQDAAAAAE